MVQLTLTPELFKNNRFEFTYQNRVAQFTIVDEEFAGHNRLGRINRMVILVGREDEDGTMTWQTCGTVISFGDGVVGIRTDNPSLRGKPITKDNMESCLIELYEDSDE